jgi:hypothetical protein
MSKHEKTDSGTIPTPDHAAIRSHVEMLHALACSACVKGIIAFTRINDRNKTHTERFAIGDANQMADAIIGYASHPGINLYASHVVFRNDLPATSAGGEDDVRAVLCLVGDLDSDIGKKAVGLDGLPLPAPYVIESSKGNFQPVFPLGRALSKAEAKPIAMALSDAIGGDSGTKDTSHLWRIPGTLNWPTQEKLDRGRSPIPQLVTVKLAWSGETVEPGALWKAVEGFAKKPRDEQPNSGGGAGTSTEAFDDLPADLKKLIAAPPYAGEDQSETAASVAWKLFRRSWSNDAVRAIFEEHANGVGKRYADEKKDLRAEVERLRQKFNEKTSEVDDVARLNKSHAVMHIGGKVRVVTFGELPEIPGFETITMTQTLGDFAALQNKYLHSYKDKEGELKHVRMGNHWINSPKRRQYDGGMAFMPRQDGDAGNRLNLWRGFGVNPIKPDGTSGAAA